MECNIQHLGALISMRINVLFPWQVLDILYYDSTITSEHANPDLKNKTATAACPSCALARSVRTWSEVRKGTQPFTPAPGVGKETIYSFIAFAPCLPQIDYSVRFARISRSAVSLD